jgi:hypothetical protein
MVDSMSVALPAALGQVGQLPKTSG